MEPIDFDTWETDAETGRAVHPCGFHLVVEGDVRSPSGVTPAGYPEGMSYADQARLLRCGMEALAAASAGSGRGSAAARTRPAPTVTTRARKATESARLFAERKDRPQRPKLSLKKSP